MTVESNSRRITDHQETVPMRRATDRKSHRSAIWSMYALVIFFALMTAIGAWRLNDNAQASRDSLDLLRARTAQADCLAQRDIVFEVALADLVLHPATGDPAARATAVAEMQAALDGLRTGPAQCVIAN